VTSEQAGQLEPTNSVTSFGNFKTVFYPKLLTHTKKWKKKGEERKK